MERESGTRMDHGPFEKARCKYSYASHDSGGFLRQHRGQAKDIEATQKHLKVIIDGEAGVGYTVRLIGTRKGFDCVSRPVLDANGKIRPLTRGYSNEIGQVLFETLENPAIYEFQGDELYVRAIIVSSKLQNNPAFPGTKETAWVQPVMLKED